ncbi:ammonia transporter [Mycena floridula]|nr:ammonia transporter [Mycena floridula]
MIPGLGFFYAGLLRRKNALSMMYLSMMTLATVSFQWFFWGYSLSFSETGSAFIVDLKYFGLKGVLPQPSVGSARIPALVFCIYQLMFAAITMMLAIGAQSGLHLSTIQLLLGTGRLDFAGGTPVHIPSGAAGLAILVYLGKRTGYGTRNLA